MYPGFPGGWKCCLQAAVSHHKRSYTSALGCSPQCTAFDEPAYLPADDIVLGIIGKLHLQEIKKAVEKQTKHREALKRAFDKLHNNNIPAIQAIRLYYIVQKGYGGPNTKLVGPI